MDWSLAIERNREALKRILASLVTMAGLDAAFTFPLWPGRAEGAGGDDPEANTPTRQSDDCRPLHEGEVNGPTLPRYLHRAVLRLLRPAESAARRLIIVMAREVVVTLPPQRPRKPKPKPTILRHRFGTGIIMPRGVSGRPPLPLPGPSAHPSVPHKGEQGVDASESPSPLWGGVRGGGKAAHTPALPLLDPLPRPFCRRRPAPSAVPRISIPGYSQPAPIRRPPSPDDPINAARLAQRLQALVSALDDLPGQAKRFARWRARRDLAVKTRRAHRFSPLRPGPAYGVRRPYSRRRAHEVDEVLRDLHYLAHCALERPDTS